MTRLFSIWHVSFWCVQHCGMRSSMSDNILQYTRLFSISNVSFPYEASLFGVCSTVVCAVQCLTMQRALFQISTSLSPYIYVSFDTIRCAQWMRAGVCAWQSCVALIRLFRIYNVLTSVFPCIALFLIYIRRFWHKLMCTADERGRLLVAELGNLHSIQSKETFHIYVSFPHIYVSFDKI